MIAREDIRKQLLDYRKLDTLEPLFDRLVATDDNGYTRVYSYEQLRKEYNRLVDDIGHFLGEIYRIDRELEEYMEACQQISDELHG